MKIGIVERVGDDAEHGLAHGRREEQVLALGGDGVDDALHVGPEAHVEHAVGLVEDERVDLVEQDVALAEHVEQAAGGRDQEVDALADALGLRVVGNAAEDGDDAAAAVGGQRLADLLDLAAQLAGRSDDQSRRMRLLAVHDHRRAHVLEDGQHEGGRLAGARLGAAHDVAAGEHARDGVLLDRRGVDVAHSGHAGQQLAFEAERGERRDLDLGGRTGRLLDVLALLVGLVDALAAAVTAVAAVTLATALAATVVAARTVVLATAALAAVCGPLAALGGTGRSGLCRGRRVVGRRRRVLRAGRRSLRGARRSLRGARLGLRGAALRGAVRGAAPVAAPAAALAAALLPALGGRRVLGRALSGSGDGRVGGGGGHRFSLPRRLRTRRITTVGGGIRMLARDQRCAREFVLWGATRRAARLSTDWCSFPSEHCPVVHNVCGSHAGGRPGAWRLGGKTGSRSSNQTLSGLHSTLKRGGSSGHHRGAGGARSDRPCQPS